MVMPVRKTFLKKGIREVWAHKFQYFFLVLVLGMGIASYGSLFDMSKARGATLEAIYEESNFMDAQVMIEYGQTINLSTLDTILSPGYRTIRKICGIQTYFRCFH